MRVPEDKLGRFCEGLRKIGVVRSENRSSSDNTSSDVEAQRNLEMAEKTLSAQWTASGSALSAKEKGLVDAEFKADSRDGWIEQLSQLDSIPTSRIRGLPRSA